MKVKTVVPKLISWNISDFKLFLSMFNTHCNIHIVIYSFCENGFVLYSQYYSESHHDGWLLCSELWSIPSSQNYVFFFKSVPISENFNPLSENLYLMGLNSWDGWPHELGWLASRVGLAGLTSWAGWPHNLGWLASQAGLAGLTSWASLPH